MSVPDRVARSDSEVRLMQGTGLTGHRAVAFAGLIFAVLVIGGCARHSPHGVSERYLENLEQFNYAACYNLLSQQDRKDRSLHEFLTEIPLAPDVSPVWFRPVLHSTHYELGPEHRNSDGTGAYVPVRIITPDLALWERTLDAAAGPANSGSEKAQRSLDTGDYPKRIYDDEIFLVKERHHWRVVAGFAARDRVIDQHRGAMIDYYENRFDKVISTYQSMIVELEKQQATGNLGLAARYKAELAEVEKVKAQQGDIASYSTTLKLKDVAIKMSEERVPAIFGAITNLTGKPIDQVALAVTWYEGRGKDLKAVHREEHPIVLTPIEFTDFDRPVIPFVPGETRRFGFILTAPTQIQQEASPYVTIASIALTQMPAPSPKIRDVGDGGALAKPSSTLSPTAAAGPPGTAVAKPQSPLVPSAASKPGAPPVK